MAAPSLSSFCLGFGSCAVLGLGMAMAPRWAPCPPSPPGSGDQRPLAPAMVVQDQRAEEPEDDGDDAEDCDDAEGCGHCELSWDEVAIDQIPSQALAAARESMEDLMVESAELAKLGPITLFAIHGTVEGVACSVIVTGQGTVLQADTESDEESMPSELIEAMRGQFPGCKITEAVVTHAVTYYATIETADGRTLKLTFDTGDGLSITDADDEDGDDDCDDEDDDQPMKAPANGAAAQSGVGRAPSF